MKKSYRFTALAVALMISAATLTVNAEETAVTSDSASTEAFEPGEMPSGGMPDGERPEMPEGGFEMPDAAVSTEAAPEEEEETAEAEEDEADTVDFDGTVVNGTSKAVTSKVGGTVESVNVRAGQKVTAGDVLGTLATDKVYATEDGTVSAVFGTEGDDVSTVADRYGAVLYIEPDSGKYTISADTENAYSDSDNLYIHVGEEVYLKCYSDGDHTGIGYVASVSGSSYTVEVTSGTFEVGETVSVFRDDEYASKSRLGRGTCERGTDIAVGGSSSTAGGEGASSAASIVALHVSAGDTVKKGDLLYETLNGTYDAYYCTGSDVVATASGIIGELSMNVGGNVNADDTVAVIYPENELQIAVTVNEADLEYITEGKPVTIEFNYDDGAVVYDGTVFSVSYMTETQGESDMTGGTSSSEAEYTAYIDFAGADDIRIGMTATVYVEE